MSTDPSQYPPQYQQPPAGYEQPPQYQQPPAYGYTPPSGYGQPYAPVAVGVPQRTSGMAIASLVLSLVGASVLGIIFGHLALNEIKKSNGTVGGQGLAMAGLIIGYVSLGLTLIVCCVFVLLPILLGIGANQNGQPGGFMGVLSMVGLLA